MEDTQKTNQNQTELCRQLKCLFVCDTDMHAQSDERLEGSLQKPGACYLISTSAVCLWAVLLCWCLAALLHFGGKIESTSCGADVELLSVYSLLFIDTAGLRNVVSQVILKPGMKYMNPADSWLRIRKQDWIIFKGCACHIPACEDFICTIFFSNFLQAMRNAFYQKSFKLLSFVFLATWKIYTSNSEIIIHTCLFKYVYLFASHIHLVYCYKKTNLNLHLHILYRAARWRNG